MVVSDLGQHNQEWLRNLHFKLFPSIYLLKMFAVFRGFNINITWCVRIIVYRSEETYHISQGKHCFRKFVRSIIW